MGMLKLVRAAAALVLGEREEESLDPTDGGLNVHLVGGAGAATTIGATYQKSLTAAAPAVALGTTATYKRMRLTNTDPVNIVYVGLTGETDSTGTALLPWASEDWPVTNPAAIFLYAAVGSPKVTGVGFV